MSSCWVFSIFDAFLFSVMRKYWIRTAELSVLNSHTDMTVLLYADQPAHAIPRTGWQLTTGFAASLFLICWGLLCCCSLFSCGFSLLWPVLSVICSFIPQYCASALGMHSGCFPRWRVKLNRLAFKLGHLLVIRDAPMYLTVVEFCQVKALVSGSAKNVYLMVGPDSKRPKHLNKLQTFIFSVKSCLFLHILEICCNIPACLVWPQTTVAAFSQHSEGFVF